LNIALDATQQQVEEMILTNGISKKMGWKEKSRRKSLCKKQNDQCRGVNEATYFNFASFHKPDQCTAAFRAL